MFRNVVLTPLCTSTRFIAQSDEKFAIKLGS